jgi:AsmA protein
MAQANRVLRTVGIVIAAVAVLAIAAFFLIDVNKFRPQIQAQLEKQLGRAVELGTIRLRWFPLSIDLSDVKIAESANFATGRPFATVAHLAVRASLGELLRGQFQVKSLLIENAEIELVRNTEGDWNYESLGKKNEGGGSSDFELKDLQVENSRVALSKLGDAGSRAVYGPIAAHVEDFSKNNNFKFDAQLGLPDNNGNVTLKGSAGPIPQTGTTPVNAKLTAEGVRWAALAKSLQMDAEDLDGKAKIDVDVKTQGSAIGVKGTADLTDVKMQGRNWGTPINAKLDALYDQANGRLHLAGLDVRSGSVPLSITGDVLTKAKPVSGDLSLQMGRSQLRDVLPLLAIVGTKLPAGTELEGSAAAQIRLTGPLSRPSYAGSLQAEPLKVKTKEIAEPLQIPSLRASFSPERIALEPFDLSAATTKVRAQLAATGYAGNAPKLDFNVTGDQLDVARLRKLFVESSTKKSSGPSELRKWRGEGTFRVARIQSDELVLENVTAPTTLADGVLRMSPVTASLYGGTHQGTIEVDLKPDTPVVRVDSKLQKVDTNKLLTATSSMRDRIFGALASNMNASFVAAGADQIVRSLNGSINLDVINGQIKGFNVLDELGTVARFAGFNKGTPNLTQFSKLRGRLDVRNGVASSNDLQLEFPGGSLAAAGSVNLVDQTLNLKVTSALNSEFSQQVGGTRVGGYLSTVLANSKGELVIPAIVTGSLSNPKFMPDPKAIAEMKLKQLLPSAGNPGSLVQGLTDAISGGKPVGRSILDALTGKQQQQQQQQPNTGGWGDPPKSTAPKADAPKPDAKRELIQGLIEGLTNKQEKPPEKKQ